VLDAAVPRGQMIGKLSFPVNRNPINRAQGVVTIRQIKAARALLDWSQSDLARHSSVSEPTIARLESTDGELGGRLDTVAKIKLAVEKAGIEFIDENGGGPGVRLRKRQRGTPSR
jgi:transcriptional regulator with XRE-family HTH domain